MVGFVSREDRGIGDLMEVDVGTGYQVCLEFGQINLQGSSKSEGSSDDAGHNLTY